MLRLGTLARDLDIAVLVVHHPNKKSDLDLLLRPGGSIAITGGARAVLAIVGEPHGTDRILVPVKMNLAPVLQKGLPFTIASSQGASRINWGAEEIDVDERTYRSGGPSKVDEAVAWLRTRLKEGEVPSNQLKQEALREGISERTFQRAREEACKSERYSNGWMTRLA